MRNDFDRHFSQTRSTFFAMMIVAIIIKIALIGGLIWLAVYAINAFTA